jgi:hypothetical protein
MRDGAGKTEFTPFICIEFICIEEADGMISVVSIHGPDLSN